MGLFEKVNYKKDFEWEVQREENMYVVRVCNAHFKEDSYGIIELGKLGLIKLPELESPKGEGYSLENLTVLLRSFEIFAESINSALLSKYDAFMKYADLKAFFWEPYSYYGNIAIQVRNQAAFAKK